MQTNTFTESIVEEAALQWFVELGFGAERGPEVVPGELHGERKGLRRDSASQAAPGCAGGAAGRAIAEADVGEIRGKEAKMQRQEVRQCPVNKLPLRNSLEV